MMDPLGIKRIMPSHNVGDFLFLILEPRSSVTLEPGKIFISSFHWLCTEELCRPVDMGQCQGKGDKRFPA